MSDKETGELSGKERYEQEKLAKKQQKKQQQPATVTYGPVVKHILYVAGIALVVFLGYKLIQLASAPLSEDFSRAVPDQGRTHVNEGEGPETYTSNPPTSGPHYVQTARTGFRGEEIADGHIIHNLEHGDIWISYKPDVSADVIEQLKQFSGAKVIITPRSSNDTDIALAAWNRIDGFNIENGVLPEERIQDFIRRYINKGPEQVPASAHSTGV